MLITDACCSSVALLGQFRTVRGATLEFVGPLSAEDMMVQSCAEASPVKWHLAHTSWFFETFVLVPFVAGYRVFDGRFGWLFNSYYNSLGVMPEKNLRASFSRPPLATIVAYREHVDRAVQRLLAGECCSEALERVQLGLQHEQQHLELIATDIKHALFTNPLHPAYRESSVVLDVPEAMPLVFHDFAGGLVEVGADSDGAFAFDNEMPRHKVYLEPFRLANRLATCGEYLAFMADGGYTRPELWLSEGWSKMRAEGWEAPLYWQQMGGVRRVFTLDGWRDLEPLMDTPVCHISLFEADAFARWSGARLATEFEWEHVAAATSVAGNLLESGRMHPVAAAKGDSMQQIYGDAWEWTGSPYSGYPGYRAAPGALGEYNGKFMSSQVVLRGGSCVTPATHIRTTYRNFFAPGTRWQFSGVRLAKDART
jgi:ergothioneine biosynthesis protein EgtB